VKKTLGFVAVLLLATSSPAAESEKYFVPVYVSAQCDGDSVGERLIYKVREAIRRSASMQLADAYKDSIIQANIICSTPSDDDKNVITRYSQSVTFINTKGTYDFALTHAVGRCGASKIDSCAERLAASIDDAITEAKAEMSNGKFKPFDP
jgi:hypothetical protein